MVFGKVNDFMIKIWSLFAHKEHQLWLFRAFNVSTKRLAEKKHANRQRTMIRKSFIRTPNPSEDLNLKG